MSRILFWLALVFLVMFAIRSKLRDQRQRNQRPQGQDNVPPAGQQQAAGRAAYQARAAEKAVAEAEVMLCCAHCGVYYPASETVKAEGRDFCSSAHAGLPAV